MRNFIKILFVSLFTLCFGALGYVSMLGCATVRESGYKEIPVQGPARQEVLACMRQTLYLDGYSVLHSDSDYLESYNGEDRMTILFSQDDEASIYFRGFLVNVDDQLSRYEKACAKPQTETSK